MPQPTIVADAPTALTGLSLSGVFSQPEMSELGQKVARFIELDKEIKRLTALHIKVLEREQVALKKELKPLTEDAPGRRIDTDGGVLFITDREVAAIDARTDHMLKYLERAS